MGAILSLVLTEITLVASSVLSVFAAVKSTGQGRTYSAISASVNAIGFIVSLIIAIFLA